MKRLRQAEVLSKVDTVDKGLNAMRSALWRRQRRRHRAWMQTRIKPHSQERPEAGPRSHRPCGCTGQDGQSNHGLDESRAIGGKCHSYLASQRRLSVASPGTGGASKPVREPPTTRRASSPKR